MESVVGLRNGQPWMHSLLCKYVGKTGRKELLGAGFTAPTDGGILLGGAIGVE